MHARHQAPSATDWLAAHSIVLVLVLVLLHVLFVFLPLFFRHAQLLYGLWDAKKLNGQQHNRLALSAAKARAPIVLSLKNYHPASSCLFLQHRQTHTPKHTHTCYTYKQHTQKSTFGLAWYMWTCRPLLLCTFECALRWAAQPHRVSRVFFKVRLQWLGFTAFSPCFLSIIFFSVFFLLFLVFVFAIATKRNQTCGQQLLLPLLLQLQFLHAVTTYIHTFLFQSLNCSAIFISAKQFITLNKCLQKSKKKKKTSLLTRYYLFLCLIELTLKHSLCYFMAKSESEISFQSSTNNWWF